MGLCTPSHGNKLEKESILGQKMFQKNKIKTTASVLLSKIPKGTSQWWSSGKSISTNQKFLMLYEIIGNSQKKSESLTKSKELAHEPHTVRFQIYTLPKLELIQEGQRELNADKTCFSLIALPGKNQLFFLPNSEGEFLSVNLDTAELHLHEKLVMSSLSSTVDLGGILSVEISKKGDYLYTVFCDKSNKTREVFVDLKLRQVIDQRELPIEENSRLFRVFLQEEQNEVFLFFEAAVKGCLLVYASEKESTKLVFKLETFVPPSLLDFCPKKKSIFLFEKEQIHQVNMKTNEKSSFSWPSQLASLDLIEANVLRLLNKDGSVFDLDYVTSAQNKVRKPIKVENIPFEVSFGFCSFSSEPFTLLFFEDEFVHCETECTKSYLLDPSQIIGVNATSPELVCFVTPFLVGYVSLKHKKISSLRFFKQIHGLGFSSCNNFAFFGFKNSSGFESFGILDIHAKSLEKVIETDETTDITKSIAKTGTSFAFVRGSRVNLFIEGAQSSFTTADPIADIDIDASSSICLFLTKTAASNRHQLHFYNQHTKTTSHFANYLQSKETKRVFLIKVNYESKICLIEWDEAHHIVAKVFNLATQELIVSNEFKMTCLGFSVVGGELQILAKNQEESKSNAEENATISLLDPKTLKRLDTGLAISSKTSHFSVNALLNMVAFCSRDCLSSSFYIE